VTLKNGRGKHRKYLPYVFTEEGVAMLSGVLKSETDVKMSIRIMLVSLLEGTSQPLLSRSYTSDYVLYPDMSGRFINRRLADRQYRKVPRKIPLGI